MGKLPQEAIRKSTDSMPACVDARGIGPLYFGLTP